MFDTRSIPQELLRHTPPRDSLSFYLFWLGFIPGRLGAWSWILWGAGSIGVSWDRCSGCNLKTFDPLLLDRQFLASHAPFLPLGLLRLWRLSR